MDAQLCQAFVPTGLAFIRRKDDVVNFSPRGGCKEAVVAGLIAASIAGALPLLTVLFPEGVLGTV